jgi:DNA-binding NarL/FixJ family response regulator
MITEATFTPIRQTTNGVTGVLIVDDHPIFRHGVRHLLSALPDIETVGEAVNAQSALQMMHTLHPDLAIIDISLPKGDGIALATRMLRERPGIRILIFSMHEDPAHVLKAIYAGAHGYLIKQESLDCLPAAVECVRAGGLYLSPRLLVHRIFQIIERDGRDVATAVRTLSPRELEVFHLMGSGISTSEIADRLQLSVKTIETHRVHIKDKLRFDDLQALEAFSADWLAARPEVPVASREAD